MGSKPLARPRNEPLPPTPPVRLWWLVILGTSLLGWAACILGMARAIAFFA